MSFTSTRTSLSEVLEQQLTRMTYIIQSNYSYHSNAIKVREYSKINTRTPTLEHRYKIRHDLGGWKEEAYEALYRMGRVALKLKRPWPEVQQLWLDAHAYLPKRIEPLYKIASYYYSHGRNYPLAYLFASRAARIPYPSDLRLFITKKVYDYKIHDLVGIVAYYVGEYEDGKRSVLKALESKPNDKRLLRNLKYYVEAAS